MTLRIAVVFHSERGHTRVLADALAGGAASLPDTEVRLVDVQRMTEADWRALADADAIALGCPTFMGSVSAPFKAFMDASSRRAWATQLWKDKLACAFTNSSGLSGDKLATLVQLAVFAAQHSMLWVSLGLMPGHNTSRGSHDDLNRLGSHLGAMAQSNADQPATLTPPESDRRTATHLGRRLATLARRMAGTATSTADDTAALHEGRWAPPTFAWQFPPPERPALPAPLRRANLRELAARPARLEHHLMVVARVGQAQLELTTASEPLAFAHQNLSDEYHLALPTGDTLLEALSVLTLLGEPETGRDVGRYRHRLGELVLHPFGWLHWPGRQRPPYPTFEFGPGMRRCGLSLLFCAPVETPPGTRPLFVSAGREDAVKRYPGDEQTAEPVPMLLADVFAEAPRTLAVIGDTRMELVVPDPAMPHPVAPPRGGYLIVLSAAPGSAHFPCDIIHIPPGSALDPTGLERALLIASEVDDAQPPPATWSRVPEPPFAPFEDAPPGRLPLRLGAGLVLEAIEGDDANVRVTLHGASAEVPRYWLARTAFRVALHDFALGYVETYGGFFFDARDGRHRLGVRGLGHVELDERELLGTLEQLYRAVAPAQGYRERLA